MDRFVDEFMECSLELGFTGKQNPGREDGFVCGEITSLLSDGAGLSDPAVPGFMGTVTHKRKPML
jgi:hypothetical protein